MAQDAIDQLVQRRPLSAGPIGELFTKGGNEEPEWKRAIELYSMGLQALGKDDVDLLARRARGKETLQNWPAAADDWVRVATGNPEGARLLAEFATRLEKAGQSQMASSLRARARKLYEAILAADPGNTPAAHGLASLPND